VEIQFNNRVLKHHTAKCMWGVKIKLHTFVILTVDGQGRRIPASVILPPIESSECYWVVRLLGLKSVLTWRGRLILLTLLGVETQSCSPRLYTSLTGDSTSALCMNFFYACCIFGCLKYLDWSSFVIRLIWKHKPRYIVSNTVIPRLTSDHANEFFG